MEHIDRREVLLGSGAASGRTTSGGRGLALAAENREQLIPWADQPPPVPPPAQAVVKTLTPGRASIAGSRPMTNSSASVTTSGRRMNAATWRLDVVGQVNSPHTYTLNDLKARPRQEVTFTLECSGDNGLPFLTSAIGNAKWAGASVADVLGAAKARGEREGSGVLRRRTGAMKCCVLARHPNLRFTEHFARSMSIEDAMSAANILCYEMNGEPLTAARAAPPCD